MGVTRGGRKLPLDWAKFPSLFMLRRISKDGVLSDSDYPFLGRFGGRKGTIAKRWPIRSPFFHSVPIGGPLQGMIFGVGGALNPTGSEVLNPTRSCLCEVDIGC
jgi:hypothetical protein